MAKYSEDNTVEKPAIGSEKVIRVWEWGRDCMDAINRVPTGLNF